MIGAILADAFLGKYRTILWLSILYSIGCIALAVDHTRYGLAVGLVLIALGAGVMVSSGSAWFPAERDGPHLRLTYGETPLAELLEGVRRLASVMS